MPTATASAAARSSSTSRRSPRGSPSASRHGHPAVERHRELQRHEGRPDATQARHASFWARASNESACSTGTPRSRSHSRPPPASRFGSSDAATTFAIPGLEHGIGARRRRPVMGTGLHRDVEGRPSRPFAGGLRATTSACGPPLRSCQPSPSAASSPATTTAPDDRVRPRGATPALGELQRPFNLSHTSSCSSRRYARGRSCMPKIAEPATIRSAPASYTLRMFSFEIPPSTWT